jgi:hypothetical protein
MPWFGCPAADLRAIRLMSIGRSNLCRFTRKTSLAKRLSRLRSTAPPTFRLIVIPIRERSPLAGATNAIKKLKFSRLPVSDKLVNSERFKKRSAFFRKKRNGWATLNMDWSDSIAGINLPAGPFPWHDGGSALCGRSWLPYVYGIHDFWLDAVG